MTNKGSSKPVKKIKDKTILITGGTGFIGSHLVQELDEYCDVLILSRSKKNRKKNRITADITHKSELLKSLKKIEIDVVFHNAAYTVTPEHKNGLDFILINSVGTKNLLELCRQKNIPQIIYGSTMEVFGEPHYNPVNEIHPKLPESWYGISKLVGEHFCREYSMNYGIRTTVLRYSYVYGPRLPDFRVIHRFITQAVKNDSLTVYNRGKSSTDYIYVKDVVTANILAAERTTARYEDFNIGSGTETPVEDLARAVINLVGAGKLQNIRNEKQSTTRFAFDISKAREKLKFNPIFSLREGLQEQINYIITSK